MRRFRILFALVAVALLVPTALLARRALESVEIERSARQESVAERLFDEMERALSGFLATEEERPFGQYAYEYTPPGESPNERVRSPLSEPPPLPFVLGYFQVDPDGSLRFPVRASGKADAAGDASLSPQASAAIREIERTVSGYWRSGASGEKLHAALNAQAPGSTLELAQAGADQPMPELAMKKERKAEQKVSAYDALRSLNKGVEQRADRQSKVSREYASEPGEEAASSDLGSLLASRSLGALADSSRDEGRRRARANEADRFELSPMVGRLVADRRLMLFRTVVHEKQGYRQGLLLDVGALGDWLRGQALGKSELSPYATISFATSGAAPVGTADPAYQHRFAEPFEELSARLVLAALPGIGGAGSIYALGIVSLVVVMLGLAAIYRMVSVVVRYAEQRSNFVAAVTHELKTPLTAIRMYGEMLRDGIVPSEAKRDEYHRNITAESERLTRLVNNVLELSRLEKGSRRTRLDPGDLGAVVREAALLLRPHVEGAGFTIRLDIDEELPAAHLERDAVLQMLFNLVDNAVKYAADGGGSKEILLGCRKSGAGVSLTVRDHGRGVATRNLRKIFEPFYRGESELTRRSKGTGLGLALVRGLAEEMGARVSGRNHPDGGLEIEIVFPGAPSAPPAAT